MAFEERPCLRPVSPASVPAPRHRPRRRRRSRCRARRCDRACPGHGRPSGGTPRRRQGDRRRPSRAGRRRIDRRKRRRERHGTAAPRQPRAAQSSASVATSFQFGSRERVSRAKVQTSLTSATVSGSPSIDVAGLVAGRRDQLADDAQRHMRLAALHLGRDDVGLVDADEGGLDLLRSALALGDRRDEAVIDFARQQVLQRLAVAVGIGHDDHLIGHLGAVDEGLRLEGRVGVPDRAQALVEVGARLGEGVDRRVGLVAASPGARLRGSDTTLSGLRRGILVARCGRPYRDRRAGARCRCGGRARCAAGRRSPPPRPGKKSCRSRRIPYLPPIDPLAPVPTPAIGQQVCIAQFQSSCI